MTKTTNNYLSIFEIPSIEFSRAIAFYEGILKISITPIDMDETQMGLFPFEGQPVSGAIINGPGYTPSESGILIYLNGGDDLQDLLDDVVSHGGKITLPKTLIDEENGYFATFLDSEGNKLGVHSPG